MKSWHRYAIILVGGLAVGLGTAWALTGGGTKATDPLTRAMVARSGLLALPAKETLYWMATTDGAGAPLDGDCRYSLSGSALDARWWSVTIYDEQGYLVDNAARNWSVNGANVALDAKGEWRVTISPDKPAAGAWLPVGKDGPFQLTLRMYNPGKAFRAAPARAALPQLVKEGC